MTRTPAWSARNRKVTSDVVPDKILPGTGRGTARSAVESTATTLPEIIQEMLLATTSERQGRAVDDDDEGGMEDKKKEGYF